MATLTADAIAIDCPNPSDLAKFYADLLGVEPNEHYVRLPESNINLWFQAVEGYQPPTWPTQERGQQLHLDFASGNHERDITHAVDLGATLTGRLDGYHSPILLDPVGHPFCLVSPVPSNSGISLVTLNFDAEDVPQLIGFYHHLLGGTIEPFTAGANLRRSGEITFSFQHAEGYRPPTWPTQERGQEMHIDFHSDDRSAAVADAVCNGATLQDVEQHFTVLLDPAGHPFCICDPEG